jgi:uncharacterized membrane protein YgcG
VAGALGGAALLPAAAAAAAAPRPAAGALARVSAPTPLASERAPLALLPNVLTMALSAAAAPRPWPLVLHPPTYAAALPCAALPTCIHNVAQEKDPTARAVERCLLPRTPLPCLGAPYLPPCAAPSGAPCSASELPASSALAALPPSTLPCAAQCNASLPCACLPACFCAVMQEKDPTAEQRAAEENSGTLSAPQTTTSWPPWLPLLAALVLCLYSVPMSPAQQQYLVMVYVFILCAGAPMSSYGMDQEGAAGAAAPGAAVALVVVAALRRSLRPRAAAPVLEEEEEEEETVEQQHTRSRKKRGRLAAGGGGGGSGGGGGGGDGGGGEDDQFTAAAVAHTMAQAPQRHLSSTSAAAAAAAAAPGPAPLQHAALNALIAHFGGTGSGCTAPRRAAAIGAALGKLHVRQRLFDDLSRATTPAAALAAAQAVLGAAFAVTECVTPDAIQALVGGGARQCWAACPSLLAKCCASGAKHFVMMANTAIVGERSINAPLDPDSSGSTHTLMAAVQAGLAATGGGASSSSSSGSSSSSSSSSGVHLIIAQAALLPNEHEIGRAHV